MLSPEARDDLIKRLRKIEGQTQGIQRMLAHGRDCQEVLNQLSSVRSATRSVSLELMRHQIEWSLHELHSPDADEVISKLIQLLMRA